MLFILLSQLALAQIPLFDADCGDLEETQNGAAPLSTPYTNVRVRFGISHHMLIVEDTAGTERTVPLLWDQSFQRYVARFSNGEAWLVTGQSSSRLTVQIGNKEARCASTVIARDAFDGSAYDPGKIWRAVVDVAGACGPILAKDEP